MPLFLSPAGGDKRAFIAIMVERQAEFLVDVHHPLLVDGMAEDLPFA